MSIGIELTLTGIKKTNEQYRRNKGKSLIDFPDNFTLVDIETTGLSSLYDEIIELSAIKIRNNEIVDSFSTLVKPEDEIDEFITELTGITNEMLQNAPNIKDIIGDYLNFIGDDIVVGYNVNFDINFVYDYIKMYKNIDFRNNYVDLMRICKKFCDLDNHKLKTVAEYYNISTTGHHRGLNDCKITFEIYKTVRNEILSKYNCTEDFFLNNWEHKVKAKDITTLNTNFDTSHILFNRVCVFTGTLSKMTRKEAMQKVADIGAVCSDNITKDTNFLIIGEQDYTRTVQKDKSRKVLKAEEYILKGLDIQIIPESLFYELIEEL